MAVTAGATGNNEWYSRTGQEGTGRFQDCKQSGNINLIDEIITEIIKRIS